MREQVQSIFEQPAGQKKEMVGDKLDQATALAVEKLEREGLPVTSDCRIDMRGFSDVYLEKDIKSDTRCVENWEMEWFKSDSQEEIRQKRSRTTGERFERLATVILHKFLGDRFIVVRTSLYDDFKNKVDNIILDKKTDNVICAFDEVGDASGERYFKKREEILNRNKCPQEYDKNKVNYERRGGGASLKYGLKMENGQLSLGKIDEIPIFLLALPEKQVEEGIKSLEPSLDVHSNYDKKLFAYFVASLEAQIKLLQLTRAQLSDKMKQRISQFEDAIREIRKDSKI